MPRVKPYGFIELIKDKKGKTEKEKKGMRSGVLDADLMLGSKLRKFAQKMGFIEDDEGINVKGH